MGLGLLLGALLARRRHFRAHAWCQSTIVLINVVAIVLAMIPSFRGLVSPKLPMKLAKSYYALATIHAALGGVTEIAGLLHTSGRRYERITAEVPNHQV